MREKKDFEELSCQCCGSKINIGIIIGENLNIEPFIFICVNCIIKMYKMMFGD